MKYNYLGEDITDIPREFSDPSFGDISESGEAVPDWSKVSSVADEDGFDTTYTMGDGYKERVILPKGTLLIRYGTEQGRYTAPQGTAYEMLGLPWNPNTIEYHEYEVIAGDFKVMVVYQGIVAPAFNSRGGGIQYMHTQAIINELKDGYLKEVFAWKQK